jgi:hypothetical protein
MKNIENGLRIHVHIIDMFGWFCLLIYGWCQAVNVYIYMNLNKSMNSNKNIYDINLVYELSSI